MTSTDKISILRFNLAENALDSLYHSIDLIAYPGETQNDARRLKQAIRSVSHGVELLLKEKLRKIHPSLVYEKVEKFGSLDARTVTVELAILRLQRIGGIEFSGEEISILRPLRNTRNAIEHYAWSTNHDEASAIIGRSLNFAIRFAERHLALTVFDYGHMKDGLLGALMESNSSFKVAYNSIAANEPHHATDNKTACDFCRGLGVPSDGGACTMCGHWHHFTGRWPDFDDEMPF